MNPTFSFLNGQVKTPFRWFDSEAKKTRFRSECRAEFEGCPYQLLTPSDSLLPFQFARPSSVSPITTWQVYDLDGNLVVDLTADIANLRIDRFSGYDYITYFAEVLSETLPEGFHYSTITSGGYTYYSEDFYVKCAPPGPNTFVEPPFGDGILSGTNEDGIWGINVYNQLLTATSTGAGNPTDPALAVNGSRVANLTDNLLYTHNGSVWNSSTPLDSTGWFNSANGVWLRYNGGAWQSLITPLVTANSSGLCFSGTTTISETIPLYVLLESAGVGTGPNNCRETVMRFTFTVSGMTTGNLTTNVEGTSGPTVTADGSYSFTAYMANGYAWNFEANDGFDGCVTDVEVRCLNGLDDCHMKLTWDNCGTVGNIYYGQDFENIFYLPQDTIYPRAETKLVIEYEEDDNGEKVESFRRKEVTWSMFLGLVPWYIADALTEMCLHDNAQLTFPDTDGNGSYGFSRTDTLLRPSVTFDRSDALSKCLVPCTLTFELDNTAVACCDDFAGPCLSSCGGALGLRSEAVGAAEGDVFVTDDAPTLQAYDGAFYTSYPCDSGKVQIVDSMEGGGIVYTLLWDLNLQEWIPAAVNSLAQTDVAEVGCDAVFRFTVVQGYSGILQYWDGLIWNDIPELDMSAAEWQTNSIAYNNEQSSGLVRLKVYVDDCLIGYSAEVSYTCS